jgi:hypothetical protein
MVREVKQMVHQKPLSKPHLMAALMPVSMGAV